MSLPEESDHRSRASKPSRRPEVRSTAGWNTRAGVPSMPRCWSGVLGATARGDLRSFITLVASAGRQALLRSKLGMDVWE